jgi:hypothetical protein
LIIPARFNGPSESGNGGYVSGMLASYVAVAAGSVAAGSVAAVTVTLREPPPLDIPMSVTTEDGTVSVANGERLIASASPAPEVPGEPVPPVPYAEALALGDTYPGLVSHPFPTCFVCGPKRDDGLRLFPGRLPDGRTAAAWRVPVEISPVLVWASLDCPGGWSIGVESRPYLLGRLTASINALPEPGDECVVMGHAIGFERRKAFVASTLYGPSGDVLARGYATWIALPTAA